MPQPAGRGNGLHASTYVALADLAPQVADAVLELLASDGIAAYAAPATERLSGQFVVPRMDRILDRVYVDSQSRARARELLDIGLRDLQADLSADDPNQVTPDEATAVEAVDEEPQTSEPQTSEPRTSETEAAAHGRPSMTRPAEQPRPPEQSRPRDSDGSPSVDDDAWAQILAAYAAPDAPDPQSATRSERPGVEDPAPLPPVRSPRPLDAGERDEEHFVPPPPPPLPRPDPIARAAWVAALGAPVFFFVVALVGARPERWMLLLGLGAFLAGFVTLVARMQDRPPTDTGPDDGAVV